MKLMPESIEQAIAKLESDGQASLCFWTFLGRIQIAFRRADGSVAISSRFP